MVMISFITNTPNRSEVVLKLTINHVKGRCSTLMMEFGRLFPEFSVFACNFFCWLIASIFVLINLQLLPQSHKNPHPLSLK